MQRTFYLCHHASKACQRVATAGCPSSPVDLIVIKECERVGAIGHQHGLEGVHLKNVRKPSGLAFSGRRTVVAPLTPHNNRHMPLNPPIALNCTTAQPSSHPAFAQNVFPSLVQKGKACRTVHPAEKRPEKNLGSDSAAPIPTSISLGLKQKIQSLLLSMQCLENTYRWQHENKL